MVDVVHVVMGVSLGFVVGGESFPELVITQMKGIEMLTRREVGRLMRVFALCSK